MYTKKIEEDLDCGIRVAFRVFGGKWKLCILDAINRGIIRPAEINKNIAAASSRVIELQLAELLFHGVIEKFSEDIYPKRTEYRLTDLGKSILPLLSQIDRWGTANAVSLKARLGESEIAL